MFDLSLAEVGLIVVAAAVFIGPKELPAVIRAVARAMRGLRSLVREFKGAFSDLARESGLEESAEAIEGEMRMIRGDDGKLYESYSLPAPDKKHES